MESMKMYDKLNNYEDYDDVIVFRSVDKSCLDCVHLCKNHHSGESECVSFKEKPDTEQLKLINEKLKKKRINLKKLCKGYFISDKLIKLDLSRLKKMLKSKLEFEDKYLTIIQDVLNKDKWIDEYIEKTWI